MRTINISCNDLPGCALALGQQGENNALQVVIDISDWIDAYGEGSVTLALKRPTDSDAYPVALEVDGSEAVWTVSSSDTAIAGTGLAQLSFVVGNVVAKSVAFRTQVFFSVEAKAAPPDPYLTWFDYIISLIQQGGGGGGITDMPIIVVDDTNAVGGAIVGAAKTAEPNYTPMGSLTSEKASVVSDVGWGFSYNNYKLTISGLTINKASVVSDAAWRGTGVNLINKAKEGE